MFIAIEKVLGNEPSSQPSTRYGGSGRGGLYVFGDEVASAGCHKSSRVFRFGSGWAPETSAGRATRHCHFLGRSHLHCSLDATVRGVARRPEMRLRRKEKNRGCCSNPDVTTRSVARGGTLIAEIRKGPPLHRRRVGRGWPPTFPQ